MTNDASKQARVNPILNSLGGTALYVRLASARVRARVNTRVIPHDIFPCNWLAPDQYLPALTPTVHAVLEPAHKWIYLCVISLSARRRVLPASTRAAERRFIKQRRAPNHQLSPARRRHQIWPSWCCLIIIVITIFPSVAGGSRHQLNTCYLWRRQLFWGGIYVCDLWSASYPICCHLSN